MPNTWTILGRCLPQAEVLMSTGVLLLLVHNAGEVPCLGVLDTRLQTSRYTGRVRMLPKAITSEEAYLAYSRRGVLYWTCAHFLSADSIRRQGMESTVQLPL